jgi:type II secretory pathway component PulJ
MSALGDSDDRGHAGRCGVRRGEAGFTLIELAVATVVLLLAVLLACELLAESGRLLHHSVRRARDPWPLLAAELLRNDLRGARPPGITDPRPTHLPLQLVTDDDGLVTWGRSDDGYLVRSAGGVDRAYIQQVLEFQWRPHYNAIEVWVKYRTSTPYLHQLAGELPQNDPGQIVDLHLVVVARGGGGTQQW